MKKLLVVLTLGAWCSASSAAVPSATTANVTNLPGPTALPSPDLGRPAGKTQHLTSPDQVPQGVAKSDWASIRAAYEAGRHAFQPVPGQDGVWQARNPGQQWLTKFDGRGFLAEPKGGGWQWGLELKRYGFPGAERGINGGPAVRAEGQRLSYGWDAAVEEWFVNDPRGLEHGFTVRERPPHEAASRGRESAPSSAEGNQRRLTSAATAQRTETSALAFTLAVRGSLVAAVAADGQGVEFHDAAGATVINYSGLKVTDADGKTLASRFAALDSRPSSLVTLLVDERDARYPLTIDPIAQQAYLKASNAGAHDGFGRKVAVSGDTVVVGAWSESSSTTGVNSTPNDSASQAGAAYVFVRNGTTWSQQAYLKASNTEVRDVFGYSVAVSGDTVVVGAYGEDSSATGVNGNQATNNAPDSGAAYVFVRSGTTWSQQAYLKASNTGAGDYFGYSVAVSGDTVVVGAIAEASSTTGVNGDQADNSATNSSGAAYVFVRNETTWTQQAYLKASNAGVGVFGYSVAVSGDTVVVGAQGESSSTTGVNSTPNDLATDAGAAYVFVRGGTNWSQQAYLKASNTGAGDYFGYAVAVSGDTVVVGAYQEDSNTTGVNSTPNDSTFNSGAAYVFVRSGTTWSQQAYLKASNTEFTDYFGRSVAVSGDTVVVGANYEDSSATGVNGNQADNSAAGSGAAYVFVRSGTTWSQQAYLKASNTGATDGFGYSVAVSGDTVVVGADYEDSSTTGVNSTPNESAADAGAAYVFTGFLSSPEMAVEQPAGTDIVDGSATVSYGSVAIGAISNLTFTIKNTGNADLTGLGITMDGPNAALFTVTASPTAPVSGPTGSTSFTVRFAPTSPGAKTAALHIASNDSDENPFDITLTGVGVDTTPPSLTCPSTVTVNANPSQCYATGVVLGPPAASDNSGSVTVTSNAPAQFLVGTNVVTWTATDPSGNSNTCAQLVIVRDAENPSIHCPAPLFLSADAGQCAKSNVLFYATATDNCTQINLTCTPPSGASFAVGTNEVLCTATDGRGNTAQCAFIVTITDNENPQITCPPNLIFSTDAGHAMKSNVTYAATASANMAVTNLACVPPSGSSFALGSTSVTCTASDSSGNSAGCSFTVTLNDTESPQLVCPAHLLFTQDAGQSSKSNVTFIANATDNVAVTNGTCTPPSGATFPLGTNLVTCTATDSSGNTAQCSFPVVVTTLLIASASDAVNLRIPDGTPVGLVSATDISTPMEVITEMTVTLNVTGGFNGDLHAYLVHDSGHAVLLSRAGKTLANPSGYSDAGFKVTFDDGATNGDIHNYRVALSDNPNTPLPGPLTGSWAPDGRDTDPALALDTDTRSAPLSAFTGLNPNGRWTLFIADVDALYASTLVSWGLQILGTNAPPVITAQPQSRTNVLTTEAVFSVTATGLSAISYQWYLDSTALSGATNATLHLPNVQVTNAGSYSVRITTLGGSTLSQPAILTAIDQTVNGTVEMEFYAGPTGHGAGTRLVSFMGTDATNGPQATWNLSLNFTNAVAPFTIAHAPLGLAHLSAKTAWHLRTRLPVGFSNGVAAVNFTGSDGLRAGDLDESNTVDFGDYFILAGAWCMTVAVADLDGSGFVDLDDYFLLSNHWLESGDPE